MAPQSWEAKWERERQLKQHPVLRAFYQPDAFVFIVFVGLNIFIFNFIFQQSIFEFFILSGKKSFILYHDKTTTVKVIRVFAFVCFLREFIKFSATITTFKHRKAVQQKLLLPHEDIARRRIYPLFEHGFRIPFYELFN